MTQSTIKRTTNRNIVTIIETKVLKRTGPKRRHNGAYDTLPYGFKEYEKLVTESAYNFKNKLFC